MNLRTKTIALLFVPYRRRVIQAEEDYSRLNMKASNKILLGCNYLKNKPILKINTKIIIIINRKKNGYFLTNSGLPDVIYFIYLTNLSNLSYIFIYFNHFSYIVIYFWVYLLPFLYASQISLLLFTIYINSFAVE